MLINKDQDSQETTDSRAVKRKISEIDLEAAFPLLHTPAPAPASHVASSRAGATPVMTPMTPAPVKGARATRKWLENVISPLPSELSNELKQMLVVSGNNIVDEVMTRANMVVTALFPTSRLRDINLTENLWLEQRRSESLKLYYRVLESICHSEARKLNTSDLGGLLANERFHRCMVACSAELVSAAQTGNGMLLSVIFDRTGITAFDLSKVIASFIIYEPTLPRELRRHLNTLQELLLEKRVWEKGSSLYSSLIVARPALLAEINQLQLLGGPMPSLETMALNNPVYSGGLLCSSILQKHNFSPAQDRPAVSPKKVCTENGDTMLKHNSDSGSKIDSPPAFTSLQFKQVTSLSPSRQNAFTSPTGSNTRGFRACSEINILFSNMSKLAAMRIQSISESLKLPQQFREKVYLLFQLILAQRTTIFFNRHMDQILLCCFYGLAKKSGMNLPLKQIFSKYMKQPQCRSQVFLSISGNQEKNGGQFIELVGIYNNTFLPSVASFLEEICHAEQPKQIFEIKNNDESSNSHYMSVIPSLPDISPKKVSPSHNVYVSPVRLLKDDLNSTMTKRYYAIIGESIYPYESPSKQLSDINKRLNRTKNVKRRLNFDNGDAAMISDEVVVKSLFSSEQ